MSLFSVFCGTKWRVSKQENSEWTSTWLECERKSHCRGLPGEELFEMGLKQWGFKIDKCRSKQPEHVCWGVTDITEVQPNRPDSGNDFELEPNTVCNGQQKSIWNVRHFSQVRCHSYQHTWRLGLWGWWSSVYRSSQMWYCIESLLFSSTSFCILNHFYCFPRLKSAITFTLHGLSLKDTRNLTSQQSCERLSPGLTWQKQQCQAQPHWALAKMTQTVHLELRLTWLHRTQQVPPLPGLCQGTCASSFSLLICSESTPLLSQDIITIL